MTAELLTQGLTDLYGRLQRRELRPSDVVRDLPEGRIPEACMRWAFNTKLSAQPDAAPLGRLKRDMGAILDCGAHWGYTALAMRLAGSDCPIVSFEAYPGNADCLAMLRRLDGNYDFVISALGETPAERRLYCPAVNGVPVTGLNCIDGETLLEPGQMDTVLGLLGGHIAEAKSYTCQLLETLVTIARLDDLLKERTFAVPVEPVAAIKLDVDGFEMDALRGATQTLGRHAPLLMIEGGNREEPLRRYLHGWGYCYADIEGDQVRLTDAISMSVNGYWLHPRHMARYEAIGLVVPAHRPARVEGVEVSDPLGLTP